MTIPSKRLVVLFDGTDNTPEDNTNVWRTSELLAEKGGDGVLQQKKYFVGVGNDWGDYVRGSIFGRGVAEKIQEGYQWLVENYQDDAEIYVFGFSRGAFSARSLVQMIANCGLIRPETLPEYSVKQAFERYAAISQQATEVILPIWELRFRAQYPAKYSSNWKPTVEDQRFMDESQIRQVKIKMAGLWDTVGAIGKESINNVGPSTQKSAEHNVRPTKAQEYGYHAVAVDENRPMFDVTLWRVFLPAPTSSKIAEANEQKLSNYASRYEQRWFIGAHSDVGGGYHEDDLPNFSLHWMMTKASALGLAFKQDVKLIETAWKAKIHDSYQSFAWGFLTIWDKILPGDQRNYRTIIRDPKTVKTVEGDSGSLWSIHETVDESVYVRLFYDSTYRPPALVKALRKFSAEDPDFLKTVFSECIPPEDLAKGNPPNSLA